MTGWLVEDLQKEELEEAIKWLLRQRQTSTRYKQPRMTNDVVCPIIEELTARPPYRSPSPSSSTGLDWIVVFLYIPSSNHKQCQLLPTPNRSIIPTTLFVFGIRMSLLVMVSGGGVGGSRVQCGRYGTFVCRSVIVEYYCTWTTWSSFMVPHSAELYLLVRPQPTAGRQSIGGSYRISRTCQISRWGWSSSSVFCEGLCCPSFVYIVA